VTRDGRLRKGWESAGPRVTHTKAFLTSRIGIRPSFSPSAGCANSVNASRISFSCAALMLCSLASFDGLAALGAGSADLEIGAAARRFAG
jgi:hypothetical protein